MSLSEIAAGVVENYHLLDAGENSSRSSWTAFSSDFTKKKVHKAEVCHASMQSDPDGCDNVITNYNVKDEDLDIRFFEFLKYELYGKWRDHINLGKHEDKYYIHLSGLDKVPANVVYNFCIASRIILEFRSCLKNWDNLCKLGVHPKLAYMVMASTATTLDTNVRSLYSGCRNTNHWPMDNQSDLSVVLGYDEGKPSKYSFAEYPSACYPCNIIWGEIASLRPLVGKSIREFAEQWKKDHPDHEDLLRPLR